MTRPIADLSVLLLPEVQDWLRDELMGDNAIAVRWVLAALKDKDDHLAKAIAVEWLLDVAGNDDLKAMWAAELLNLVSPHMTISHGIVMDFEVAKQHARHLKDEEYVGVRIVPARNGGHEIKSQGIVMRERRAG